MTSFHSILNRLEYNQESLEAFRDALQKTTADWTFFGTRCLYYNNSEKIPLDEITKQFISLLESFPERTDFRELGNAISTIIQDRYQTNDDSLKRAHLITRIFYRIRSWLHGDNVYKKWEGVRPYHLAEDAASITYGYKHYFQLYTQDEQLAECSSKSVGIHLSIRGNKYYFVR